MTTYDEMHARIAAMPREALENFVISVINSLWLEDDDRYHLDADLNPADFAMETVETVKYHDLLPEGGDA